MEPIAKGKQVLSSSPLSLEDFAMDIIQTNADLSSLMLSIRRHLNSLDHTPELLLDEMLRLAKHVQHLQCDISDATYIEKNEHPRRNDEPLPSIYARIASLCQVVRTVKDAASHYVDSLDDLSCDLELCFDSLKEVSGEYENLLEDLNDWIDILEKVIPRELFAS